MNLGGQRPAIWSKDKAGRLTQSATRSERCHERASGGFVLNHLVAPKTGNKHVAAVKYETSRPLSPPPEAKTFMKAPVVPL